HGGHHERHAAAAPAAAATSAAATLAAFAAGRLGILFVAAVLLGGLRHRLGLHGAVLRVVQESAEREAAHLLPVGDGLAGVVIELAGDRCREAETLEPALDIALRVAVEVEVLFGLQVGLRGLRRRVNLWRDRRGRPRNWRRRLLEGSDARAGDAAER